MEQRLNGGPAPSTTPMTATCLAIGNADQNGAAADELGLGISKGEAEAEKAVETKNPLPGTEGEEAGRKKETMELFPQSAGLGRAQDASALDAARSVSQQDEGQGEILRWRL